MKVAYDPQIFSAQVYGGISRYFCEVAQRIATQPGIDVSIVAPLYVNAYLQGVPKGLVSGFRAPRTGFLRFPVRGLSVLAGDLMLRTIAPDIVHETYFFPFRLGPRGARRVLTVFDMIHEKFSGDVPHASQIARYKALAAKRADHVICISEATRRDAIEILGLDPGKTSAIHLGFDLEYTGKKDAGAVALPMNRPFLLYVGRRGGYKNFLRLLEAYAQSPQLRSGYGLVCFGGGPFENQELRAIQALDLNRDQVVQLGGGDQLLARLYERASVFVYPSLYEGFGIPPLEAMAHDCPVVCGNTSSIPEVVAEAGEYCDPHEIDSIREAIEHVVGSASHRTALITKGRERAKSFSWSRCAATTLDVYSRLV